MPLRGAVNNSSKPRPTDKFKRHLAIAVFAFVAIYAVDQFGLSPGMLAQNSSGMPRGSATCSVRP